MTFIRSAVESALAQAAALARRGESFVWLDSAGHLHPGRDRWSWLAHGAILAEVRGDLAAAADRAALRRLLAATDPERPAFGWIDYAGAFHFARFTEVRRQPVDAEADAEAESPPELPAWPPLRADSSDAAYLAAIARARDYIAAGDIYQVNLTRRWSMPWPKEADPFTLYRRWRACTTAPQSAYLRLGARRVLSASPETFLALDPASRRISTHPIKGTVRADPDPAQDARLRARLSASPKERAELLMITDLLRNDLGRVAVPASVAVPALHQLEAYGHLHHLVSTVEATLRPGLDSVDLLRATHPGGSVTGAPKRRAREIIGELEPSPRGLYCGAIGWLSRDALRLSIAIRTAIIEDGVLHYHAGSGIVADSDPVQELAETELKAAGFRRALER